MLAKVGLERRIGRNIRSVVQQQIELNLVGAGSRQVEVVKAAAVGRDPAQIGDAMGVLKQRRLRGEKVAKPGTVFLGRLGHRVRPASSVKRSMTSATLSNV